MTQRHDKALEVVRDEPAREPRPDLPPPSPGDDEISLGEYLDVILDGRRLVAGVLALVLAAGAAHAFLAPPVYRSDALVQVETTKAGKGLLGDLSAMFGEGSPAETEVEILRSRALVGEVVNRLRLDVVATPRRFPLVGGAVARLHGEDGVAGPLLGLRSFGWGGERISVGDLVTPRRLLGEPLRLVAGEGPRFALLGPDGEKLLDGEVGKRAAGGGVELFVSELVARPGLAFHLELLDRDETVSELQEDLRVSEKGKKTGVLVVALEDRDPARVAGILDALTTTYVRRNVERRSAEAEKTLEFLDTQLPALKAKLYAAELELESYRSRKGQVDVSLETQAAVARVVEIEKAASAAKVEYAALRHRFTDDHPALAALRSRMQRLEGEGEALEVRLKRLPEAELESARRLRDVKVANELYIALLNKAQELKVMKEGTIGNVRVLDAAVVPTKPVAPRKAAVLALSLLLGLAAGVAAAFGRRALSQGVEDPDAIERTTGIGVHAAIPFSGVEETAARRSRREPGARTVLAQTAPRDIAVESLRSLRTSLQFELHEARNRVVAVTGPAPGVGKSFVVANLAHLLGESGKRVLAIDADLRRGRLHESFGASREGGLSELLAGEQPLADVLRDTGSPGVKFISTGRLPPNPAEMLGSERFAKVLADLAARHDVVLVDTPPVLAVTDAALVARLAGVTLLVARSGKHPLREIAAALRGLARNGARVHGIVMNGVRLERGFGRRNAYHYQYRYE